MFKTHSNPLRQSAFCPQLKRGQLILMAWAVLMLGVSCTSSKEQAPAEPVEKVSETRLRISADAIANIKLSKAEQGELPETLNLMGKVSPTEDRTTVVPARVAGRIESVAVSSGETVKQGQVLAVLFSGDFVAAKEEFIQSLKQEAETKGGGSKDFSNFSKLARKKLETMGLSRGDIDALASNENSTANLIVRAPRSGAIVTKNATVGNLANVGDTLFTIADLSQMWFVGDLYPEDLPRIKKDQEIIIDGLAGTPPIFGKVSFISPMVDPTVRSIKVRALMQNPKLALRADMYVQGNLVINKAQALLVPTPSILRDQDKNYVFKKIEAVNDQGHNGAIEVEKVNVEIGEERQGKTAIKTGLHEGDVVVSEGALLLDSSLAGSAR